jgi:hypothetical protein
MEEGVPFAISVTVTGENANQVMSDDFFDYYLDKQWAHYIWIFQYLSIGSSVNLD